MVKHKWPKWNAIFDHWKTFNVPDINIIKFEIDHHYNSFAIHPWVKLKTNKQFSVSNPQSETAAHICTVLNSLNDEMRAVYKLYTFATTESLNVFCYESISNAWLELREINYLGWGQNAKNLLPLQSLALPDNYLNLWRILNYRGFKNDSASWKEIVEACALSWTAMSEQLGIIRMPDWMDRDSDEYKAYQNYVHAEHEKSERLEYERLKCKFE